MSKATTKFGFLVGLAAVIVACSSSSGTTTTKTTMPVITDAGVCGGFASPLPQCNTCLTTACCSAGAACSGNAACLDAYDCVEACDDDACTQACLTANPSGATDFNVLTGCISNSCSEACNGSATGDAGGACGGFTFASTDCQTCFATTCCSQGTACHGNADCLALDSCIGGCGTGDTACENTCLAANPNGSADLDALGSCLTGACGAACTVGSGDSGVACGGFTGTTACTNTCITSTCCSQAASCTQNTACLAIFNCVDACTPGDMACISACGPAHPTGVADFNAFNTCESGCGCAGPDAGTADGG